MKRIALAAVAATILAGTQLIVGQSEHGGNPFIDHSDTGETIHVLPPPAAIRSPRDTQPTDAVRRGTTYSPSYGSGDLIDHGGHEISSAGFYAIYWNRAVADSAGPQGSGTLQNGVHDFITTFGGASDYSIITQYGSNDVISKLLVWVDDYVDGQPTAKSIADSKIRSYLASLFDASLVPADPNNVYGIYFPSGMKVSLQGGTSCSTFCGYHGSFTYQGMNIKYAVFPYTDCRACSMSGKTAADILTIVSSHESREAVTDPNLDAWYDRVGYEADDKCAWHNLYRMTSGGYWVQPEYSNAAHGCVVP